ncbi:TetR/AcrR family transcriptional regulator [Streptomyces ipomoeae]|uniref:Transcriptional regulator, TetR family n=1 Tax=Streptomyces ipomoeae 91-03 TaxID=698759 RepID=L1KIL0_9ACTN|nr:TetR/AcrR family transcriptional regulator [Streptomyces ipomoeae]EKX60661.1 transcriptional regulator, TetR family [Streptomyces ipomoeae 91-03]MDX2697462.1 TetR/AcrR family transcriptional regulator [Streptomyces ipomoeae]MDX2843211.1 TetR/AcrR family transcriptional regulator [Streptomyces ipomoeae]
MTEEEMTARQRAAETKRRRTRQSIVLATLDLYGDADEGDYTREQIADAADVSVATLYNHFTYKYDILQAAHERLLAPVIQPLVRGAEDGTYNPSEPVEELIRYTYAVAKMSNSCRALTVALVDSRYAVPPKDRYFNGGYRDVGSHIAEGMAVITYNRAPFCRAEAKGFQDGYLHAVSSTTTAYHARALLEELRDSFQYPDEDMMAESAAKTVLSELLPATLMGSDAHFIAEAIRSVERIRPKVDEWYEKMKQREDLAGW